MVMSLQNLAQFRLLRVSETGAATAIDAAWSAGARSPCAKSKRGVAVFSGRPGFAGPIVADHNGPPAPFICDGSDACKAACGKVAVHAEERALHSYRSVVGDPAGAHVLHLKVVDGEPVPSDTPSCVTCSRSMLELRVGWVWLWTSEGWKVWTATEFHHATLANLGLPALRGEGL
jgi:hypothetical protein